MQLLDIAGGVRYDNGVIWKGDRDVEVRIVLLGAVVGMLFGGCSVGHTGGDGPGSGGDQGVIASGVSHVSQVKVASGNGGWSVTAAVAVLCVAGSILAGGMVWLILHHRRLTQGLGRVESRIMGDNYVG
jgi:hypothetical protein